ncbi:Aldehyde/histidinol dehydrogenase [Umbelopsis sp. PMI_123]|nr:Aldehyde/histidinol dehydrogenase [Umbelopsis sp. PMI_123]
MSDLLKYTPVDEIPTTVNSLRSVFNTGLTKSLDFRKKQLQGLIDLCNENTEAIVEALHKDLRKHKVEAVVGEISLVVDECQYMIKNLHKLAKPEHTSKRFLMNSTDKTLIRKEPKGVALVIGAWNYPFQLLLLPFVGAIAAGNTAVIKPSEVSAHTAALITELVPKYLNQDAYRVINGGVAETTVVLEQRFDHIFYTGNGAVGKIVMTAAAKQLCSVTLELGGKSPSIVAPDADLDVTVNRLIWGKFYNNGQTCVAPDYVLIHKPLLKTFVAKIRANLEKSYGGKPQSSDSYGRIVSDRQFNRLKAIIDRIDASKIAIGGDTDASDRFIAPTIVTDVSNDDANLMVDEIFGPILPIIVYDKLQEAVDMVNSRDYPLALYIFTKSEATANWIMDRTQSGGCCINDTLMHLQELSLPFGGIGPSGQGNYHGERTFNAFTHERTAMFKDTSMENVMEVKYPPYNDEKYKVLTFMVYGLSGSVSNKFRTLMTVWSSTWAVLFSKKSKL